MFEAFKEKHLKKIFVLRHGQTEFNKMGIVQGRGVDAALNDHGRQQSQQFYQAYNHLPWDWIFTSKLQRTVQTVQSFIEDGIAYTQLPGLDEIHWGSKEGKPFSDEDHAYYQQVTEHWRAGRTDQSIAGGESPEQVQIRQKEALDHILSSDHQNILVCMHGRAIRIFMCLLLNYPLSSMDLFAHHNTGVYKLTYTGSTFRVDKPNCTDHLI